MHESAEANCQPTQQYIARTNFLYWAISLQHRALGICLCQGLIGEYRGSAFEFS